MSEKTEETKYSITDAEWKVMRVLWRLGAKDNGHRLSLGEIMACLEPGVSWNMNTVRTLLLRLSEKGIIVMEKAESKFHKYYYIAKEDDCAVAQTKAFVDKIFGGSAALMFSTLIKNGGISAGDRKEILELIESIKEE
jgi:BlaI family penicillinase repressor